MSLVQFNSRHCRLAVTGEMLRWSAGSGLRSGALYSLNQFEPLRRQATPGLQSDTVFVPLLSVVPRIGLAEGVTHAQFVEKCKFKTPKHHRLLAR